MPIADTHTSTVHKAHKGPGEAMNDYDEALELFHRHAPEWGGGFANHGPMVAEALETLGHPVLIPDFVWRYGPRLPLCEAGHALAPEERAAALGRIECVSDWIATFEAELAHGGLDAWPTLLRVKLPQLLPGVFAGALHGILRTAHAVRALERDANALRISELAHGLGYWSARFQALPGRPGSAAQHGRGPAASLRKTPIVPTEKRRAGFFFDQVSVLDTEFAHAVDAIDLDTFSFHEFLSDLTREAARLYLENLSSRIAYIHLVTAPSALRLLEPYLDASSKRVALGAILQAAMALHAVSQNSVIGETVQDDVSRLAANADELRYVAASTGEEHVIKFCEAALRENAIQPDPSYLLAAADAALRIGAQHGRVA